MKSKLFGIRSGGRIRIFCPVCGMRMEGFANLFNCRNDYCRLKEFKILKSNGTKTVELVPKCSE